MPKQTRSRALGAFLPLLLVLGVSCSDDPSEPDPPEHLPFGVFAVPRGTDPLLAEAYSDMARGEFAWSQMAVDWGLTELAFGQFDWTEFDYHMQQSRRTGLEVSVVLRVIDGAHLGPFPDDLRGQGFESPNVRVRFPAYAKALVERSRVQLAQLWIGRAVDERLDADPNELEAFRSLLALAADSIRTIAPDLPIGTSFRWDGSSPPAAVSALAPVLDQVGWVVLALDEDSLPAAGADEAVNLVRAAVSFQTTLPAVLTEVGYRRVNGDSEADLFLAGLHAYLESAPEHLVGATWFSLYDWDGARALDRAASVHPSDPEAAAAYAGWLRASGLGLVSGVPTALWYRALEWNRTP